MQRRDFLRDTGLAAAALSLGAEATAAEGGGTDDRPNILWIISEDTCPDFGCYGERLVHTPNVDRLAAEGARFTNAFTATPVCSTSRSSFMTGVHCTSFGAHHHRSHRGDGFTLPSDIHVFTHYLRQAGYFTAITHGRKTDWNFKPHGKPYDSNKWDDLKSHQPFFAQVQFSETHRGFKRCKDHPVDPDKVTVPPYYPDHPVTRKDWARYLETVNVLDQKIGKVLERLERDGLAENTIVFYFADHGRPHVRGKQWLYEGGIHIPLVVRWPKHIQPGTVVEELVSAVDFAPSVLDLARAAVPKHMHGRIFLGPRKQGEPDSIIASRHRCDETVDGIRCVRTRRWKYIRNRMPDRPYAQFNRYKQRSYPVMRLLWQLHADGNLEPAQARFMAPSRPPEELYDLQADPSEIENLADAPEHQDTLERLRQRLDQWADETGDLGEIPEPHLEPLYAKHKNALAILQDPANRSMVQRIRRTRREANLGKAAVPKLKTALDDPAAAVRYVAARRLGSMGDDARDASEALQSALSDSDGAVRVAAARGLCLMGQTDAGLPVLEKELKSAESPFVRHYAALALQDLGQGAKPVLATLRKARKDKYEYVRRVTTRVVTLIEGRYDPAKPPPRK